VTTLHLTFDRGTIRIHGSGLADGLPGVLWDPRTSCHRAPAYRLMEICTSARERGVALAGPALGRRDERIAVRVPPLRGYQSDALAAWRGFGRRGVVALPTGAGKTRVAIAAIAEAACATAILVPTCALVEQWSRELAQWTELPIGILGDGENRVETITVMTFESAYRRLDRLGDRFRLLVVDEAHHFGAGFRAEALEASVAPFRLGLTATPPPFGSAAGERIRDLIGPVVCEVAVAELAGGHLAPFEIVQLTVRFDDEERAAYTAASEPFAAAARAFRRAHGPATVWGDLVAHLGKTREGRGALAGWHRARAIASLPRAKMALIGELLERHQDRKLLVFTAFAKDAYAVAAEQLIPAITADIGRLEREDLLGRFRDGRYHSLVSSRVLNEGVDVPDAEVAILAGGVLGRRERLQRIGRVLRASPGKSATIYELVTAGTADERRQREGG